MQLSLEKQVEYILSQFPETRESDLKLFIKLVNRFAWCDITWSQVEKLLKAPSYTSIIRIRGKFQNQYKRFLPSLEVRKFRKQTQSDYRSRYGKQYANEF